MSIDAVSSLRRRMIEDMNARKLCAGARGISTAVCGIFATISSFFVEATMRGGFFCISVAWGQHAGGRMTVSTLILILLLTFAAAGALERLRSTLVK
jgi:hypothetical protein